MDAMVEEYELEEDDDYEEEEEEGEDEDGLYGSFHYNNGINSGVLARTPAVTGAQHAGFNSFYSLEEEEEEEGVEGEQGKVFKGARRPLGFEEEEGIGPGADDDEYGAGADEAGGEGEEQEVAEEEGDDDDFMLHFDENMDPLALALVDEDEDEGVEAFEQFQRLEYESLAARKRKSQGSRGGRGEEEEEEGQQAKRQEVFGASVDEIWDTVLGSGKPGRRRRQPRRRGRKKKGSGESGLPPEVTKKLGEANLLYASSRYPEAVELLEEVVRVAPNVADAYHTLGLLHDAMDNKRKALNFYMIAAHLTPKDTSLWKRLAAWSMEQSMSSQAMYCLTKCIRADPHDLDAKWERALLLAEMGDHKRAAESLEAVHAHRAADGELCKMLARVYHKTGQRERAVLVLQDLLRDHPAEADLTAVNILAELHMEGGSFLDAIGLIEQARVTYCAGGDDAALPVDLSVKLGICHAYLGTADRAEALTEELLSQRVDECSDLFMDVGDMFVAVGKPLKALVFFDRLSEHPMFDQPALWLKMAQCHLAVEDRPAAIRMYERVVRKLPAHTESRLALANLLTTNGDHTAALAILSAPSDAEGGEQGQEHEQECKREGEAEPGGGRWWEEPKVVVQRARLQYAQGQLAAFLDTAVPLVRATLRIEAENRRALKEFRQKHPNWRRNSATLAASLSARREGGKGGVFSGYRPPPPRNIRTTMARLRKKAKEKQAEEGGGDDEEQQEEVEEEAQVAGQAQEQAQAPVSGGGGLQGNKVSQEERRRREREQQEQLATELMEAEIAVKGPKRKEPPLPGLYRNENHFDLLLKTCRVLVEEGRVKEAKGMARTVLIYGRKIPRVKRNQLRALCSGTVVLQTAGVAESFDHARSMILQAPYSNCGWNLLHQIASRVGPQYYRHNKLMQYIRNRNPNCVPAIVLTGHQSATAGHWQAALRDYLRAYKLEPSNPFLCLCCGTAFLNLAAGTRLTNRNQVVLQAFAFLYKYDELTDHSQEASYNLGRAYHQLGLVHLAVPYYEKVLSSRAVEPHPIPTMSLQENPGSGPASTKPPGLGSVGEGADAEVAPPTTPTFGDVCPTQTPPLAEDSLHIAFVDGGAAEGSMKAGFEGGGDGSLTISHEARMGACDLKREAAHNLALIYRASGTETLVRHLYEDFLTV